MRDGPPWQPGDDAVTVAAGRVSASTAAGPGRGVARAACGSGPGSARAASPQNGHVESVSAASHRCPWLHECESAIVRPPDRERAVPLSTPARGSVKAPLPATASGPYNGPRAASALRGPTDVAASG